MHIPKLGSSGLQEQTEIIHYFLILYNTGKRTIKGSGVKSFPVLSYLMILKKPSTLILDKKILGYLSFRSGLQPCIKHAGLAILYIVKRHKTKQSNLHIAYSVNSGHCSPCFKLCWLKVK